MTRSTWWRLLLLSLVLVSIPTHGFSTDVPNERLKQRPTVWPFQSFAQTVGKAKKHLLSAAIARSFSIFGMYPLDTIKTRIQIDHPDPFNPSGLFGGIGGSLLGQVPYGILTFGSYEMYKKEIFKRYPNMNPLCRYVLASILGDLTGSFWLCPSESVKQKMQAGMFKNEREAIASVLSSGGLLGFYEGYFGGVSRDIPFRVVQMTTYEVTKNLMLKLKARQQQKHGHDGNVRVGLPELSLIPLESAMCGALAGVFSAAVTTPLDRIKTLLMTHGSAYGGTVFSCASIILREEGIRGFATGVLPRVAYIAPSVALFFVTYEACQRQFDSWKLTRSWGNET